MLDTRRAIETPEGVELYLRVAGPAARSYAWLIDFGIRAVAYALIGITLSFAGDLGVGIYLIFLFLAEWLYGVAFELSKHAATPGKRIMGLKVVHDDGTPVALGASMLRNLLRTVDFLPLFYGLGLVSCLIDSRFRRLGDIAAGTLVVYADKRILSQQIPEASPLAPPVALATAEQAMLMQFAERSDRLATQRLEELASILMPITGASESAGPNQLYRYANWILGRR